MLRLAILFTILLSSTLAVMGEHEVAGSDTTELGVGSCPKASLKVIKSFIKKHIMHSGSPKPSIYYLNCELVVSPDEDRHHYETQVVLNNSVPCHLEFSSGHLNTADVHHRDEEFAQEMINKCKVDMLKHHDRNHRIQSTNEEDYRGLVDLFGASDLASEIDTSELRDEQGQVNQEKMDEILERPMPEIKLLKDAFTNEETDTTDYEGMIDFINNVNEDYKVYSRDHGEDSFPTTDSGEESQALGAYEPCSANTRGDFFNILLRMGNSRIFRPIIIYDENLVECSTQVTRYINYDATFSINGKKCHLVISVDFDGKVELVNAADIAAHEDCSSYLTFDYVQAVKAGTHNA